jgi:hypothetical protein
VRWLRADGDVVRLRDVWGTRYGVIAGFSYGGRDRSVFLFDVDTDFYNVVVGAGDFDDTEQIVAAPCTRWPPTQRSTSSRNGSAGDTAPSLTVRPLQPWPTSGCPA